MSEFNFKDEFFRQLGKSQFFGTTVGFETKLVTNYAAERIRWNERVNPSQTDRTQQMKTLAASLVNEYMTSEEVTDFLRTFDYPHLSGGAA
jgi:hypothetical protein